ncbi:MAG: hypothetical protein MJ177_07120 [Clostridia bacterium]|nr:hypothetical protein [Clostridia bacterium]
MNQEFKIIISVIVTVWLFVMGMIIGQYDHRNSAAVQTTGQSATEAPTASAVYATNEQGAVYVDANGQPITQVILPSPSAGTVFVTDPSGAVYVDANGQPVTSAVVQPVESNPVTAASTTAVQPQQTTQSVPQSVQPSGQQDEQQSTTKSDELTDARFTADAMAIKSKNFYIEGREFISSDGTESPLKFATNGTNSEIFTDIDGAEIGMMVLDGEMYIVFNNGYLKLSKTLMDMIDVDISEYNFDASFITSLFDDSAKATVKTVKDDDGKKVTRTTYTCSRGDIKAYSDGDKLLRVEVYPIGEDIASEIFYFDSVTGTIPETMLSTSALKKKNIVSFFTEFMKATGQEMDLEGGDLSALENIE